MNYVILSYFEDGNLTIGAILFGKYNLNLIDTNETYNLYKFSTENNTIYYPVSKINNELKVGEEKNILQSFSFLAECKKIIFLPNCNYENIISLFGEEKIFRVSIQGDPCSIPFDKKVNIITSVKPNGTIINNILYNIKLCIPYFFYRHQLSLVNYDLLNIFKNKQPKDKIFYYLRRIEDGVYNMRDRAYFIKKTESKIEKSFLETVNGLHKNIELSKVSWGLYHLGNFFDYNNCMFNIIFESQHVDYPDDTQTWISEKSIFAILFANPFFLFANPFILKSLKELGIELLNDEFEGNDIEEKFDNFCKLFTDDKAEDRKKLYLKMSEKQIENRKKLLDYIHSPKKDVIEFLIS